MWIMRHIRLPLSVFAAVAALGASFAGVAAAKAPVLHLKYNRTTEITPGAKIEGFDYKWSLSSSSEGAASCTFKENNEGFYGEDVSNNEKTDVISIDQVAGAFSGFFSCSTSIPGLEPEARGRVFNENTNPGIVRGEFKLSAKGKTEYITGAPGDTIFAVEALNAPREEGCYYEVKKLKATLSGVPTNLGAVFNGQKLKLIKELGPQGRKSFSTCPKKATLTTTVSFLRGRWPARTAARTRSPLAVSARTGRS
jgi:hypothetical protein